jgi:hypothetical protein
LPPPHKLVTTVFHPSSIHFERGRYQFGGKLEACYSSGFKDALLCRRKPPELTFDGLPEAARLVRAYSFRLALELPMLEVLLDELLP